MSGSGTGSWLSRNVCDSRSESACDSLATDAGMEGETAEASSTASAALSRNHMGGKSARRPTARRMGSLIANKTSTAASSRESSTDAAGTGSGSVTVTFTTPTKRVSPRGAGAAGSQAGKRAQEGDDEEDEVTAAAEKSLEIRRLLESSPRKSSKQVVYNCCTVHGHAAALMFWLFS